MSMIVNIFGKKVDLKPCSRQVVYIHKDGRVSIDKLDDNLDEILLQFEESYIDNQCADEDITTVVKIEISNLNDLNSDRIEFSYSIYKEDTPYN